MKAIDVAKWFVLRNNVDVIEEKAYPMKHLKIQKLLYYAQGISLGFDEGVIFEESLKNWQHGPVVKEVYDELSVHKKNKITVEQIIEDDSEVNRVIAEGKKHVNILELTYKEYGGYEALKLRDMTHNERPWLETNQNDVIPIELITEFFKEEIVECE